MRTGWLEVALGTERELYRELSLRDGYDVSDEDATLLMQAVRLWVQSLGSVAKKRIGTPLLARIQDEEGNVDHRQQHPSDTALILVRDKLNEILSRPRLLHPPPPSAQVGVAPGVEIDNGKLVFVLSNEPVVNLVAVAVKEMDDENATFDLCPYCRRPFRLERSNAKYCTTSCRVQAGKKRAKERVR